MDESMVQEKTQMVSQDKKLEEKLEDRNIIIAKMQRQKQTDQKELYELKFKVEREQNLNSHLQIENETLKIKLEQLQSRFVDSEKKIETLKLE